MVLYLHEFLLDVTVVKMSTAKSNRDVSGFESSKNGLWEFSCLHKNCSILPSPVKKEIRGIYLKN